MGKWDSMHSARARRVQRRRANSMLNNQSFSTSNSDTDAYQYDDASSAKKKKLDERESSSTADPTILSTNPSQSFNEPVTKVKEEFNQGASTSTGLQSRYRSTRPNIFRVRHYRHTETSDSDEMEDSDTLTSELYLTSEGSESSSDSDTSWSKSRRNSNKQSLKRSRQQKTSASRKSRRQLSSSRKSKRSKRYKNTKNASNKSSSSLGKKKKSSKRSRRKSMKKSTSHRRKRQVKEETTTEEEQEEYEHTMTSSWSRTSPESFVQPRRVEVEHSKTPPQETRSSAYSPASNYTTSDVNDTAEDANSIVPNIADLLTSIQSNLPPPPLEADENPYANLAIYSENE